MTMQVLIGLAAAALIVAQLAAGLPAPIRRGVWPVTTLVQVLIGLAAAALIVALIVWASNGEHRDP